MALWDDRGRLFGKINIMDLIIILLIILTAAGGYMFFSGGNNRQAVNTGK
ncbi:MAG: DUF4330 family protein, partial [Clostridiaceae bacterium]|nr:DUF4330 family protein [Clostridiaceae bacterium]